MKDTFLVKSESVQDYLKDINVRDDGNLNEFDNVNVKAKIIKTDLTLINN